LKKIVPSVLQLRRTGNLATFANKVAKLGMVQKLAREGDT